MTHVRTGPGTWKKDLRFFSRDSATATEVIHKHTRAKWIQHGFSLGAGWNLWVSVMKFIHKGGSVPFYLLKDNRHKREEPRRPLQEAGKAILFKIVLNGMRSRGLLWTEKRTERGWNQKKNKTTLSWGKLRSEKNVPRDEKRVSSCCLGPKEGSLNELGLRWRRGWETVMSERGSIPLLWPGCVNEEANTKRTEEKK